MKPFDNIPFLELLKSATAQQHILLESNPLFSAIVSPQITIKQYGSYLTLMQNILHFYERDIVSMSGSEHRNITPLISADLQYLNFTVPENVSVYPYDLGGIKITSSFAWGFAYVMEGSKLGGKMIFKNIQRTLGFTENLGASFIADTGSNTFVIWKAWLVRLSDYVAANNCEAETIEGAKHAFQSVYNYFELNRPLYED